jgi:hypothetical protein
MMRFYNWLICKLFKRCQINVPNTRTNFEIYCEQNPWARECRIYED